VILEREEERKRDCNVLSLIKVFEKAASLGGKAGNCWGARLSASHLFQWLFN
jgi:hypothetical protein